MWSDFFAPPIEKYIYVVWIAVTSLDLWEDLCESKIEYIEEECDNSFH